MNLKKRLKVIALLLVLVFMYTSTVAYCYSTSTNVGENKTSNKEVYSRKSGSSNFFNLKMKMRPHEKSNYDLTVQVTPNSILRSGDDAGLLPIPTPLTNTDFGSTLDEKFVNFLKEVSPDGYYIISESGRKDYLKYIDDDKFYKVDTSVHETCHAYNYSKSFMSWLFGYRSYYLGNQESKTVDTQDVFRSNEMAASIPENLRTFRYDPYLTPYMEDLDSQKNGIYGLLEEWSAYFTGCRAAYDTYSYYAALPNVLSKYDFEGEAQTWAAYYEFKFFILRYMMYAKENYPDTYNSLIQDNDLKYVYTTINSRYLNLVKSYLRLMKEVYNNSSPFCSDIANTLKPELEKPEYIEIEKGLLMEPEEPSVTPTSTSTPTSTPTTEPGNSISGYISTDFTSAANLKSGFKVEVRGTAKYALTDENGYFKIVGVPFNPSGLALSISKSGFLSRNISVPSGKDILLCSQDAPLIIWIGDIVKDGAINISDIMELARYFNKSSSTPGYSADFDLNKDSAINISDIMIVAKHFNSASTSYPIPEEL